MNALKTGIYSELTGGSALMALATGGVWDKVAPGTASFPYLIFELGTGNDSYSLAGRTSMDYTLTLKAVDKSSSETVAGNIIDAVETLLNDATLTITGWGNIYLRREARVGSYAEIDGNDVYQHVPAVYRLTVKPSS